MHWFDIGVQDASDLWQHVDRMAGAKTPCDYFLWGICDQEIRRVKPRDLGELLEVVSDFIESLARTWSGGLSGMSQG